MELLIGAIVIGWFLTKVPHVVADAIATSKAAAAGAWDVVTKDRAARDAAARRRAATRQSWAERVADAWGRARQKRHEDKGGTGQYPGLKKYWREQYRAWWQDRIDHAQARRATRGPYDPRDWQTRWDEAWERWQRRRDNHRARRYGDPDPEAAARQDEAGAEGPGPTGASGAAGASGRAAQPDTDACPGCGEPLVDEPPRYWRRRWGPPPNRSHRDREPACGDSTVHEDDTTYTPPYAPRFTSTYNPLRDATGAYAAGKGTWWGPGSVYDNPPLDTRCAGCNTPTDGRYHCDACAAAEAAKMRGDWRCAGCGTDAEVLYAAPDGGWDCIDCLTESTAPTAPDDTTTAASESLAIGSSEGEPDVTAPANAPATNATEVQGNEDLRRNLTEIDSAAKQMADALAQVEAALARIKAAGAASADGVDAKKFDSGVTAAVHEINDNVSVATLSAWHELADNAQGAAQAGIQSLEKYRDAEDVVQSNQVDGSTLESAAA